MNTRSKQTINGHAQSRVVTRMLYKLKSQKGSNFKFHQKRNTTCHFCKKVFMHVSSRILHEGTHTATGNYKNGKPKNQNSKQIKMSKQIETEKALLSSVKMTSKSTYLQTRGKNDVTSANVTKRKNQKKVFKDRPRNTKDAKTTNHLNTADKANITADDANESCPSHEQIPLRKKMDRFKGLHKEQKSFRQKNSKNSNDCICQYCRKKFYSKANCLRHIRLHTNEKPYRCMFCTEAFTNGTYCRRHMMRMHNRLHMSDKTQDTAKTRSRVKASKSKHILDKKPKNIMHLENNIIVDDSRKHHNVNSAIQNPSGKLLPKYQDTKNSNKVVKNRHCREESSSKIWIRHESSHNKNLTYRCTACYLSFTSQRYLNIHDATVHGRDLFVCQYCKKRLSSIHGRVIHERLHSNEKPYGCTYCEETFPSSKYLQRHMKRIHKGENYIDRKVCSARKDYNGQAKVKGDLQQQKQQLVSQVARNAMQLKSSKLPTKEVEDLKKQKDEFGKGEPEKKVDKSNHHKHHKQKQSLKRKSPDASEESLNKSKPQKTSTLVNYNSADTSTVFRTSEPDNLPTRRKNPVCTYKCTTCKLSFPSQKDLNFHDASVHARDLCVCHYCKKRLSTSYNRVIHERLHSNEEQYSCTGCKKAFPSVKYLQQHVQAIHTGGEYIGSKLCLKKRDHEEQTKNKVDIQQKQQKTTDMCRLTSSEFFPEILKNQVKCDVIKGEPDNGDTDKSNECIKQGQKSLRRKSSAVVGGLRKLKEPKVSKVGFKSIEEVSTMSDSKSQNQTAKQRLKTRKTPPCSRNCTTCKLSFPSQKDLNSHDVSVHRRDLFVCQYCKRRLSTIYNRVVHERLHSNETYECTYCREAFRDTRYLQRHVKRIHTVDAEDDIKHTTNKEESQQKQRKVISEAPNLTSRLRSSKLSSKKVTFLDSQVKPDVEGDPGKNVAGESVDSVRQSKEQSSISPHSVEESLSGLKEQTSSKSQNFKSAQDASIPFQTSKAYESNQTTQKAFKRQNPFLVYKCITCNLFFPSQRHLNSHDLSVHGRNLHVCQYCKKPLSSIKARVTHERLHSKEKPYGCTFCQEAFSNTTYLQRHVKKIHTGEVYRGWKVPSKGADVEHFKYGVDVQDHQRAAVPDKSDAEFQLSNSSLSTKEIRVVDQQLMHSAANEVSEKRDDNESSDSIKQKEKKFPDIAEEFTKGSKVRKPAHWGRNCQIYTKDKNTQNPREVVPETALILPRLRSSNLSSNKVNILGHQVESDFQSKVSDKIFHNKGDDNLTQRHQHSKDSPGDNNTESPGVVKDEMTPKLLNGKINVQQKQQVITQTRRLRSSRLSATEVKVLDRQEKNETGRNIDDESTNDINAQKKHSKQKYSKHKNALGENSDSHSPEKATKLLDPKLTHISHKMGKKTLTTKKPIVRQEQVCANKSCNISFTTEKCLNFHEASVHGGDFPMCQYCRKKFSSDQACLAHERSHTKMKPYQCAMCEKTFLTTKYLQRHVKKIHHDDIHIASKTCSVRKHATRIIAIKNQLPKQQRNTMMNQRAARIKSGFKLCNQKRSSQREFNKSGDIVKKRPKCGKGKKKTTKSVIGKPVLPKQEKSTGTMKHPGLCTYCGKYFTRLANCAAHEKYVHMGLKQYTCSSCSTAFGYPQKLHDHRQKCTTKDNHTQKIKKKVKAPLVAKRMLKSQGKAKTRIRNCPAQTCESGGWNHLPSIKLQKMSCTGDTQIQPGQKSSNHIHNLSCTNERKTQTKPLSVPSESKPGKVSRVGELKKLSKSRQSKLNILTNQPKKKPGARENWTKCEQSKHKTCTYCGKTFSRRENCLIHEKAVHLKLTPYQCKWCKNKYGWPSYLYKHVRMAHQSEGKSIKTRATSFGNRFIECNLNGDKCQKNVIDKEKQKQCQVPKIALKCGFSHTSKAIKIAPGVGDMCPLEAHVDGSSGESGSADILSSSPAQALQQNTKQGPDNKEDDLVVVLKYSKSEWQVSMSGKEKEVNGSCGFEKKASHQMDPCGRSAKSYEEMQHSRGKGGIQPCNRTTSEVQIHDPQIEMSSIATCQIQSSCGLSTPDEIIPQQQPDQRKTSSAGNKASNKEFVDAHVAFDPHSVSEQSIPSVINPTTKSVTNVSKQATHLDTRITSKSVEILDTSSVCKESKQFDISTVSEPVSTLNAFSISEQTTDFDTSTPLHQADVLTMPNMSKQNKHSAAHAISKPGVTNASTVNKQNTQFDTNTTIRPANIGQAGSVNLSPIQVVIIDNNFETPLQISRARESAGAAHGKDFTQGATDVKTAAMKEIQVSSSWTCEECKTVFDCKKALLYHKRSHDNGVDVTIAGTNMPNLDYNEVYCTPEGLYKCKMCTAIFTQERQFRSHEFVHMRNVPHCYGCPRCGLEYQCRKDWVDHMMSHGNQEYLCKYCGKSFKVIKNWWKHEEVHEKPASQL